MENAEAKIVLPIIRCGEPSPYTKCIYGKETLKREVDRLLKAHGGGIPVEFGTPAGNGTYPVCEVDLRNVCGFAKPFFEGDNLVAEFSMLGAWRDGLLKDFPLSKCRLSLKGAGNVDESRNIGDGYTLLGLCLVMK